MELDKDKIEQAIVTAAVDEIISADGSEFHNKISDEIKKRTDNLFATVAERKIEEAIENAVQDGFSREYVKTNSWGEKASPPTTIKKELEALCSNYWSMKVDAQGKPAEGYSAKWTRAEYIMVQFVAKDYNEAMKQHVVNITASLKDQLRKELYSTTNKLLTELFHVNSDDDREIKTGHSFHPEPKRPPTEEAT